MRRVVALVALGFAMGLCGCGPGGTALLLLLLTHKNEKQSKEPELRPPGKAHSPQPTNNATDVSVTTNLSWGAADGALSYNLYFGTNGTAVSNATTSDPEFVGNQTQLSYDPPGNLKYNTTYFWRVDSVNAAGVTKGDVWCFTTESPPVTPPDKVTGESPFNGETDVLVDVVLSWSAAAGAQSYDVYFGTDPVAVANATTFDPEFMGNRTALSYDPPGTLAYNTTYYWRVDSVNTAGTTKGDLWSFTTESLPSLLQITTTSLPDATEGVAYSYTLSASGGDPSNYNWSVSGQPFWLAIDTTTGNLSGTPPAGSAGAYTFTVEVTDGKQTASKQFDLTVKPAASPLTITTTSLPDATEGVPYSAMIEATGGTTPYTWTCLLYTSPSPRD